MDFNKYLRPLIVVVIGAAGLLLGTSFLTYFTYSGEPNVVILGIENEGAYRGIINCSVKGESGYKVASVSILLDGERLAVDGADYVRAKNFELPFAMNTERLPNGKHILQLDAVDASYHANNTSGALEFFVDNTPLKAALLESDYSINQGRTLHPKIQINKHVESVTAKLFSQEFRFYPDSDDSMVHEGFIPVDCEQGPGEYVMSIEVRDAVGNIAKLSSTVQVKAVTFPKQKGFTVEAEKLDDERSVSMNNKILNEALEKWLEKSPKNKLWKGRFEAPTLVKRITTPFGEIRVTPERGRYLHRAVDIANDPRSVVWASQDGRVIIKDRYLFSGNTVVVDHGLGVFTKYFHLDDFADVEVGDVVKKGEPLGKIGMTGYANGYHLHWELSVNGVSVEPFEWTKKVY